MSGVSGREPSAAPRRAISAVELASARAISAVELASSSSAAALAISTAPAPGSTRLGEGEGEGEGEGKGEDEGEGKGEAISGAPARGSTHPQRSAPCSRCMQFQNRASASDARSAVRAHAITLTYAAADPRSASSAAVLADASIDVDVGATQSCK